MNKIKLLTKKFMLTFVMALLSSSLSASDRIEIQWKTSYNNDSKGFFINLKEGNTFTVNWGDGTVETLELASNLEHYHYYAKPGDYTAIIETHGNCKIIFLNISHQFIKSVNLSACPSIEQMECKDCNIQELNLSGCQKLLHLDCTGNQLEKLDLSHCINLRALDCKANKLSSLDVSHCQKLSILECYDNSLQKLDVSLCMNLKMLNCSNNLLKELYVSDSLQYVNCFNNQLTELNFAKSTSLLTLRCQNNKLSQLNLTGTNLLNYFECYNNRLPLSDLYKALSIQYTALGTQTIPATGVNLDTELFEDQSEFDGVFTKYVVEKNGNPALASDYTVTDGKLIFHTRGRYTVTMTNDAIVSAPDFPAKVIATLDAVPVDVASAALSNLRVHPNPTTGLLTMNNEQLTMNNVEVFDIYGRKQSSHHLISTSSNHQIDISHLPVGVYFLRVDGKTVKVVKL